MVEIMTKLCLLLFLMNKAVAPLRFSHVVFLIVVLRCYLNYRRKLALRNREPNGEENVRIPSNAYLEHTATKTDEVYSKTMIAYEKHEATGAMNLKDQYRMAKVNLLHFVNSIIRIHMIS